MINSPRSICYNSNMSPRLFGQVSVIKFGLVQCAHVQVSFGNCETVEPTSAEKFAILSLKPRSYVRILIYRTWVIVVTELKKVVRNLPSIQALKNMTLNGWGLI